MNDVKGFIIYKIYYDFGCAYLGRTKQPLKSRLRGHFFKKPMHKQIEIGQVVKIEYALCKSEADMFVYEVYYINKFKPALNQDDKARDKLSIKMKDLIFNEFECNLMEKWKGILVN
jgi:excinuclease UvrABC nuclease subunit